MWDSGSPLGLRITSKGAKTFVVILGRRRHTIGRYGHISLSQARTVAKQLKAEHTLGRLAPPSRGVLEAVTEYLNAITIRPNTRRYYQRDLKRLPDIKLSDLAAPQLNAILDPLPLPARGQALKVYVAFFNWCIRRHYLDQSPCKRFRGAKTTSRSRVLTNDEIRAVWNACEHLGQYGIVVRLCLLTGQRKTEIASFRPSWLCDNKVTFPKEVCKNNREHTIPVGELAISLFKSLTTIQTTSSGWWSTAKTALNQASGVTDWVVHDGRRTFCTKWAEDLRIAPHLIERYINHVSGQVSGVAAIYNRATHLEELRECVDRWETFLQKIISGAMVNGGELTAGHDSQ
jgi:integrase